MPPHDNHAVALGSRSPLHRRAGQRSRRPPPARPVANPLLLLPCLFSSLTYNVVRYTVDVIIQSFQCADTHDLFITRKSRRCNNILPVALRKLDQLVAAAILGDLAVPPGNTLE